MSNKRSVPSFTLAEEAGGRRPGAECGDSRGSGMERCPLSSQRQQAGWRGLPLVGAKGAVDPRKPSVWQMEGNKLGNSNLFFLSFSEGCNNGK